MKYEFTLKFKLPSNVENIDQAVELLAENGCTDALVGLGQIGYISLEFIRESENANKALQSAIDDVTRALPGSILIESGPDYVGISDVANIFGMSRQNVRKLVINNYHNFPAPIYSGNYSLWRLAQVLEFFKKMKYQFSEELLDVSLVAMKININKEIELLDSINN